MIPLANLCEDIRGIGLSFVKIIVRNPANKKGNGIHLELLIKSCVYLAIVVRHGDLQRVRSCTGQLVKLVEADPELSWEILSVILTTF